VKIILRKNVDKLGDQGEVVTVKDGYARNYLIPRGVAIRATEGTLKAMETEKKQRAFKIERERKSARDLSDSITRLTLVIKVKAGDEGKLYGTVTTQMVSDALKEKGFDVDRKHITIEPAIKQVGKHVVTAKYYSDVQGEINIDVQPE
jgi:large subunit ribosomal protein L9